MAARLRAVQLAWLGGLALVLCLISALVAYRAETEAETSLARSLVEPVPADGDEDPLLAALLRGAEAKARAERRARLFWRLAACSAVPGVGLLLAAATIELRRRKREGTLVSPFSSRRRQ